MAKVVPMNSSDFQKQFAYVDALINKHRTNAIASVNAESLLTVWEVGQYISNQMKTSRWGDKVVSDLADYLKLQNPRRRGFGKRHLYNMVKFYETYNTDDFRVLVGRLKLKGLVQSPIAQIEEQQHTSEIVQLPIAQLNANAESMPNVLVLTTFTNHIEILNRCKLNEERVFYMLYAAHQRL